MALLTVLKSPPLAYNKDLQEDKEALFDTVDTAKKCLLIFTPMLKSLKVNRDRMLEAARSGFTNATDGPIIWPKGVPFREAHEIVGSWS